MEEKNLLVLEGLEGNPPAYTLTKGQQLISPFVDELVVFWWITWFVVLGFVFIKYIGIPLYKKVTNSK